MNVSKDTSLFDEMLIKSVDPSKISGSGTHEFGVRPGPLYINGTSVCPRGHFYHSKDSKDIYIPAGYTYIEVLNDGSIDKVLLRCCDFNVIIELFN
jgi:hypothetical protein